MNTIIPTITLGISCRHDKRTKVIDPVLKRKTGINLYIQRTIKDLPLFGAALFSSDRTSSS